MAIRHNLPTAGLLSFIPETMPETDYIAPEVARTLPGLLRVRVSRSATSTAYGYYDDKKQAWQRLDWRQVAQRVTAIQTVLQRQPLAHGDRVAIMLRNCPEWITFDLAALGLGLVTVPLYANDSPENVAHVIRDAGVRLILVQSLRHWRRLSQIDTINDTLQRVITLETETCEDARVTPMRTGPDSGADGDFHNLPVDADELATIIYTSGTTGRPKGVMLSHRNILSNAYASLQCGDFFTHDVFLSFLPLSHALERTAGCYLPMMANASVYFARSVQQLARDLQTVRPTVLVSVPRIYEMMYTKILDSLRQRSWFGRKVFAWTQYAGWHRFQFALNAQHWHWSLLSWPLLDWLIAARIRRRLGGKLRYAIAGGAPLNDTIAKFFICLGIPVYQGYGMTESAPVISVGQPRDREPFSIGKPLPGVEIKITDHGELCTRSACVMLGYYKNERATQEAIDAQGWLHTGDIATVSERGYLYITGRIKDIIVLANAEKVSPQDMEIAICADTLFDQAMVVGEGRPFLAALLVLNESQWRHTATAMNFAGARPADLQSEAVQRYILKRLSACLKEFPGYAQVRRVSLYLEPWTMENGLLTPTLKIKRARLLRRFAKDVERIYEPPARRP